MKLSLFLCLIAAVYLACFIWVGNYGAFWSEDAGVKYLQVVNLVESRWTDAAIRYPGEDIDHRFEFNPLAGTHTFLRDGRIYSIYPPAFSFLSSIFYSGLGFPGLYLLPFLSTLATISLVYKLGRLITGRRGAAIAALVAAFCTPLFFYAFAFWEMNVAACLVTAGMYLAMRAGIPSQFRAGIAAGIIMGAAALFREEAILLVAGLVIVKCAFNRDVRSGVGLLIGAAIAGAGCIGVNHLIGGPGASHLTHNIAVRTREFGSVSGFIQYKWGLVWELLFSGRPNGFANLALLSPWFLFLMVLTVTRLERPILAALSLILAGHCVYLWLCWTSRYPVRLTMTTSGLLMFSPWVVFGAWKPRGGNPVGRGLLWSSVLCIALICVFAPTSGGLQWGPRYLAIVYPILAVASCASFMEWRRVSAHRLWLTAIFSAFVMLAAMNELQGIRLLKSKKDFNIRVMAGLKELQPRTVISLSWWAPLSTAPAFYEKEFFSARGPAEFGRLVSRLKEKGRRDFILVAPDDPDIVEGIAGRFRLGPERITHVRMQGDDYFYLIMAEYGLE